MVEREGIAVFGGDGVGNEAGRGESLFLEDFQWGDAGGGFGVCAPDIFYP